MIGRESEQARMTVLLAAARSGRGGVVALRGEPGIGKTALLAWVSSEAGAMGVPVLAATGIESEAELPFAALGALLRPILRERDALAPAQRAALEGALALGPPAAADRFASYAGAFALVEAAAAGGPLLLLVDDAHWLDAPSAEAIAFISRRVEDLSIAMVLALRPAEGAGVAAGAGEPLDLAPLAPASARALLEHRAEGPITAAVTRRILTVASGNPLALLELPRALTADERAGRAPLPEPIRVGGVITAAFRRRLEALDEATRRGLVVVAAAGGDAAEPVLSACESVGSSLAALEGAEAGGILTIAPGRIAFAHPLVRAVVIEIAAPADLREAHRALAEAIAGGLGQERRAWHLALAAVGRDDVAAAALEEAGMAAAARTAYASAMDAMVRSAELTSVADERARRLLQASGLAHLSGRMPLAVGLLAEASELAESPGIAGEIDHMRGMLLIYTGPSDEGVRVLFDNADRIAAHSPERAALMLADASMAWGMAGHPAMCIVSCERAMRLGPLSPAVRAKIDVAMANSLLFVGRGREARALLPRLDPVVAAFDPISDDYHSVICGIVVHTYMGEFATAQRETDRAVTACRETGALGPLAFYLATGADLAFRQRNWAAGMAAAQEGAQIAEETGQVPIASYALAVLARLEAACGQEERCREHLAASATLASMSRSSALDVWNGHGRALLDLGAGRLEEVIATLEEVAVMWHREEVRCPEAVRWRQDLVEAYARSGRVTEARRHLREFGEEAVLSGTPATHALVSRCRGLLADDYPRHFDAALALHARLPIPFDEARTRLVYGERLRRDRRRARAREQLAPALAEFEALGARPWAERARAELAATGASVTPPSSTAMERLTPRELQVAMAVAGGATNREAARALFLSEKTVERHLSAVYAKLGLRSRTELARLLARGYEVPAG